MTARSLPQFDTITAFDGGADSDASLRSLARRAGIALEWTDNQGETHNPSADTLRAVLRSLGLDCDNPSDIGAHSARLQQQAHSNRLPPMATAWCGEDVILPLHAPAHARVHIEYDIGVHQDVILRVREDGAAVLPPIARPGYHRIEWNGQSCTLAVAPQRAWTLKDVARGARMWGLTAQTYGLSQAGGKSQFGVGAFGDAAALAQQAARLGADALMLSPAHALFHADPSHFSPYSPSNRNFYNALLCDPALVFAQPWLQSVQAALPESALPESSLSESSWPISPWPAAADGDALIDWPEVSQRKYAFLRKLFEAFMAQRCSDAGNRQAADFAGFQHERGTELHHHALFEALQTEFLSRDPGHWHWRTWPAAFQSPDSPQVRAFAEARKDDVAFHMFLQWLAFASGAEAQSRARAAGMRIGMIADLAVGVASGGSHAWSRPQELMHGLSIGAPPDALGPRGQNWGLTTFSPLALSENGFAPFLAMLRATLAIAGGVRIDHVMGLMRLWLIPEGGEAADGAYLSYPYDDLLRLAVLESRKGESIVIGEDLGTVPPGLRETLEERGVPGMRVLIFEKDGEDFRPPGHYPAGAIAMTTTHDTATLRGWQRGADIDLREELDQLPPGVSADAARIDREGEREAAARMFAAAGLGPSLSAHMTRSEREEKFNAEAIALVAQCPAQLALIPLEDAAGAAKQPNLPGTVDEYPNWRRRYDAPVDTILSEEPARSHIAALVRARPRAEQSES